MSSRARGGSPTSSTSSPCSIPCWRSGRRSPPRITSGEIKVHGANIRDPVKGHGAQALHVDVPKKFNDDWWVVNAMILFDDMTLENGPTRVVPGSHLWAPINVPVVNQGDGSPSRFPRRTRRACRTISMRPIRARCMSPRLPAQR